MPSIVLEHIKGEEVTKRLAEALELDPGGTYRVTVPAGTFNAVLVRVRCEGKVGPAHTQDTAYYFFAPGTGVVAMIMQEDAEAFWIIHIDSTAGKVLTAK